MMIIPHQVHSHVISSFTLSYYLKDLGYNVFYLASVEYSNIIIEAGFNYLKVDFQLIKSNFRKKTLMQKVKQIPKGIFFDYDTWKRYSKHKKLSILLEELQPDITFLDTSLASFEVFFRENDYSG